MKQKKNPKKIKIAILFHKYSPENEGISVSIKRLAHNLPSNFEVHIISGQNTKSKLELLQGYVKTTKEKGVFIHYFPFDNSFDSERYGWSLDNFLNAIKTLHTKYSFDILHSYYVTPSGYIGTLASKLLNIPCIVSVRGGDIGANIFDTKRFGWIEWTLNNCDYVTFVNEYLKELAQSIAPISAKSKVIPNSFFADDVLSNTKSVTVRNKTNFVLGYIGDIKKRKGFIYLLEALNDLKTNNIHLLVLGSFAESEKEIYTKYIKENHLSKIISFHKPLPHERIGDFFEAVDAVILPSIDEGSPNVLFESMFFAKPIIGTNISAINQTVNNEIDALLVEPRNPTELKKAILKLSQQHSLANKLGKNAKAKSQKMLGVKSEVQQFESIYHPLLKNK